MNSAEEWSLVAAVEKLKSRGYKEDFNLKQNCLECQNGKFKIFHDEFQIDEVFEFDETDDPSDRVVLYAISSPKYSLKGTLVNGYGIYSEPITNEMLHALAKAPGSRL
ncbi:MAG: hypothetical protein K2X47_18015 [Bdellovibrionales bacterium]|nr:hypothetical protein [Bdellovibrionales bacterium]